MVLKFLANLWANQPKTFESYLHLPEKTKKNMAIRVLSMWLFLMRSMPYVVKGALILVEQVTFIFYSAAKDDVVNQLLTNLDGV